MAITLKQIEAAYWVEKLGSFHAAAERLNTTQSTISKRIQELEQSLGFLIFDRLHKNSQVTLKGRGLLNDFSAMLSLQHKIEHGAKSDSSYSSYFHLGATEMVGLTWLSKLIKAITARFPNINLKTSINLAHQLQDKLNDHKFDLILCPETPNQAQAGLSALPLSPLEFAWLCSDDMAANRRGVLSIHEIISLPLLTYAEGSLLHQALVRMLAENGCTARQTITCNSMIALAELVRGGLGIAYMPRDYFQSYDGLRLLHTNITMPPFQYVALYRDHYIASQIAELAQSSCSFMRPAS